MVPLTTNNLVAGASNTGKTNLVEAIRAATDGSGQPRVRTVEEIAEQSRTTPPETGTTGTRLQTRWG